MPIRIYYILWTLIAAIYAHNMTIDVMEVDAAQYASMATDMYQNGNFLQVYHRGQDYLDKPPLLFWLSSLSFSVFGVSNFSYKLPAVLILLLGLWSTYRFVLLYHRREVALMATTMLATTQAYFLMTNDVRTDGLLTGFVMFSVYQCAAFLHDRRWSHLILAGIGIGLAMLAKGPIGAVIPGIAIVADRLMRGRWKELFHPRWLVVGFVALLVLVPMCYGLYMQFDMHPEKSAYGLQGPSGIEFFFWTQSFGRITGDIYWDNNTPVYYLLLTFLWDFMPWTALFFGAFALALGQILNSRTKYPEYMTIGGFVLAMILLSLSRYKLPHYTFPLFPFAAILAARYLDVITHRSGKVIVWTQFVLLQVFFVAIVFGFWKVFPPANIWLPVAFGIGYVFLWRVFLVVQDPTRRIFLTGVTSGIIFNLFLSLIFYPQLLQYQAGTQAGKMVRQERIISNRLFFVYPSPSYSLDFYAGRYIPLITANDLDNIPAGSWIFVTEDGFLQLMDNNPDEFRIVERFGNFHVSMLKMGFLIQKSRQEYLKHCFLLEKLPDT